MLVGTDQFRAFSLAHGRSPAQQQHFYARHRGGSERLAEDFASWVGLQRARFLGLDAAPPPAWLTEDLVDWLCRDVGAGISGLVRVSRLPDDHLHVLGLDSGGAGRREQVLLAGARVRTDGSVEGVLQSGTMPTSGGHGLTFDLQHDGWDLAAADLLLLHLRGGFAVEGRWVARVRAP